MISQLYSLVCLSHKIVGRPQRRSGTAKKIIVSSSEQEPRRYLIEINLLTELSLPSVPCSPIDISLFRVFGEFHLKILQSAVPMQINENPLTIY
jgi:hypothetical protein